MPIFKTVERSIFLIMMREEVKIVVNVIVNALNNCVYDNTDDAHDCDRNGIFAASQSAQKEPNKFVSYPYSAASASDCAEQLQ